VSHASDHAHDHHDHPPHLGHHWDNSKQQFEAGKLGMWLFLATEILLFGGLFVGYAVWRGNHPELFQYGSHFLDTKMGAINTCVLILSSLTMAAAVTVAQRNDPKTQDKRLLLCGLLVLTLVGAAGFMVIKYFEYTHKFHTGIYPGVKLWERPHDADHISSWDDSMSATVTKLTTVDATSRARTLEDLEVPEQVAADLQNNLSGVGPAADAPTSFNLTALEDLETGERRPSPLDVEQQAAGHGHGDAEGHGGGHGDPLHPALDRSRPRDVHMFFNIYYMMTGLHGIHVVIGGLVIFWLLWRSWKGEFHSDYFTPVDLGGLYWHVVDLIWIFLFPLFYLIH